MDENEALFVDGWGPEEVLIRALEDNAISGEYAGDLIRALEDMGYVIVKAQEV